jgi:hypothetical protein
MTNTLTSRRLIDDEGSEVTVSLSVPYTGPNDVWTCDITIHGLEEPITRSIYGIDGFQALYNALNVISIEFREITRSLTYAGGVQGPGFYRVLTDPYGLDYLERIHAAVDAEDARFREEIKDRAFKKSARAHQ